MLASINQLPAQELSNEEKEGIILMREEEKLARDVYHVLYSVWNSNVFNNISLSEQRHTDAVKRIIEKYQLTDPVADDANGVFTNNTLKTLYAQLTEAGKTSLVDGLKVGAAIEEIDILDLQHQLNEVVDNQDIQLVYKNLMLGSYNHLKSFVKNLSVQGITYSPQYLDEETYNSIINN
ncbi:MAG: DUF2202 domain-containing protein [Ignavibacteriales bacterium]|nr:MAG: DUF2202 domain-containing protein [Ignavibacteriales bacterium]